jgi:hypothetical protein
MVFAIFCFVFFAFGCLLVMGFGFAVLIVYLCRVFLNFEFMRWILACFWGFVVGFVLCGSAARAQQRFVVVSDYDDTFRITGTKKLPMLWNALFTSKIYAGADVLYRAFEAGPYVAFYVVSNSPEWLRGRVQKNLKRCGLLPDSVYLFQGEGLRFDHKIARILELAAKFPEARLVLLGDDATADHLVYDSVARLLPNRVEAVYIRPVEARVLPRLAQVYYTEFEIARAECNAGRLPKSVAMDVGKVVLEARRSRYAPRVLARPLVMPNFVETDADLARIQSLIFAKIVK